MSMSFKASPDGTFGEILVNGQVVAKLPVTGNAVIPGLVGTVSQSGGVPTGAVVERGSNANGEYVRFADGTQICTGTIDETKDINTAYGSGDYVSSTSTYLFSAVFSGSGTAITGTYLFGLSTVKPTSMVNAGGTSGSWNCQHCASASGTAVSIRGRWVAVGRWF